MEHAFAYFLHTDVLIDLFAECQQVKQFESVGYRHVFTWAQVTEGQYVRLLVFAAPDMPIKRRLQRLDFESLCRRAIGGESEQHEQQRRTA